ncbi:MAG: hypothetical protein RR957_06635 [Oscillospiraceae bacterium]
MENKSKQEKKQLKNLLTYAIIMMIGVMIIIIIAAMADGREKEIDAKIDQTHQTNMSIQSEVVALKDENYLLKKQNEELLANQNKMAEYERNLSQLRDVWGLYTSGSVEAATQKLANINISEMDANLMSFYESINNVLEKEKAPVASPTASPTDKKTKAE